MRRKILITITLSIISLFVILNVLFSQQIHPLYFSLINNDQKSAIQFLKDIRFQPEYSSQYQYFTHVFGNTFKDKMITEKTDRERMIIKYEDILKEHPESKDILLDLALLYYQNGEKQKSFEKYNEAKAIDPGVRVEELED